MSSDADYAIIDARGRAHLVSIHGEVDLSNAGAVEGQLLARLAEGRCIVDLNGLTFIDSAGLRMLNDLGNRYRLAVVLGPQAVVRRAIEIVGLSATIPTFPTLDEAEASFL